MPSQKTLERCPSFVARRRRDLQVAAPASRRRMALAVAGIVVATSATLAASSGAHDADQSTAGTEPHRLGPYSVEDAVVEDRQTASTTGRYTVHAPSGAKNIARVTLQLAACEPAQEIVAMSHGGSVEQRRDRSGARFQVITWEGGQRAGTTIAYTYTVRGLLAPIERHIAIKSGRDLYGAPVQVPGCDPTTANERPTCGLDDTTDCEIALLQTADVTPAPLSLTVFAQTVTVPGVSLLVIAADANLDGDTSDPGETQVVGVPPSQLSSEGAELLVAIHKRGGVAPRATIETVARSGEGCVPSADGIGRRITFSHTAPDAGGSIEIRDGTSAAINPTPLSIPVLASSGPASRTVSVSLC